MRKILKRTLSLTIFAALVCTGCAGAETGSSSLSQSGSSVAAASESAAGSSNTESAIEAASEAEAGSETGSASETEAAGEFGNAFLLTGQNITVGGNGELATAELILESVNADIEGKIAAGDIILSDAFKDLKVESVSNDERTVTLNLSGNANLERESYCVPAIGTVEIGNAYFGGSLPARGSVTVKETREEPDSTEPVFWPYFEAVNGQEFHIQLMALCGEFAEDFNPDNITLGLDFENAEIISLEKDGEDYDLVIKVPDEEDQSDFDYAGNITLSEGSMTGTDGVKNAEPLSVSREYSDITMGREISAATGAEAVSIAGVVKGFNDISDLTFTGVTGGGASVFSGAWTVLGLCGLVPGNTSANQKIMDALYQLHEEIQEVNDNVLYCRGVLDQHTDMIRKMNVEMDQYYLNFFNRDMIDLKSAITELEYGLKQNQAAIEAEVQALTEIYGDGELTAEQTKQMLFDLDVAISEMRASANYTMSEKLKELKRCFGEVAGLFFNCTDSSNPITAYCNMHSEVDNFATTSLADKQLYAAEIEYQLNKALAYIEALDGVDAHAADREKLDGCVFPDVTAGTADANGNPLCYLMNGYVRLATLDEVNNMYWKPLKNKSAKEVNILSNADADAAEFYKRCQGRTMSEELAQAGIRNLGEKDISTSGYDRDACPAGLAFNYYRLGSEGGWGKKKSYWADGYLLVNANDSTYLGKREEDYAICSNQFMLWDGNQANCAISLYTKDWEYCSEGAINILGDDDVIQMYSPMLTLVKV